MPNKRRILIVDDADEARDILAIALATVANASVETASSAEDALSRLGAEPVDVLVTDFRMRGMNGFELLTELKGRGIWPRCGAVVMSGELNPDLRRRALEEGAAAFFSKPFSTGEVRRSILLLLESSHDAV